MNETGAFDLTGKDWGGHVSAVVLEVRSLIRISSYSTFSWTSPSREQNPKEKCPLERQILAPDGRVGDSDYS